MLFTSTTGKSPAATLSEALFAGLAPDGGLYQPERLDPFTEDEVADLVSAPLSTSGPRVMKRLLGDALELSAIREIVNDALDFEIPLREIEPEIGSLELFWGPTLAFKDVGARFMARLMARLLPSAGLDGRKLTILVATSGDTGSAVAHAFWRLPEFRVVVLFPRGHVSEAQQKLFSTLGDNVHAVAVDGVFDDCQRLVKAAFADHDLRERRPLASANSINIGRLLPQSLYYFHLCHLHERAANERSEASRPLWVATPSGNFGNLTAGLIAKRLGAPIARFIAATNVNDIVPTYLQTGDFAPRASTATLSNAMDVGNPSNFHRMLALYDEDLGRMQADIDGARFTDEDTVAAMRTVHEKTGIVLDPHAAVGWLGISGALRQHRQAHGSDSDQSPVGAFLATAHPAKFADVVEDAIGTSIELPEAIRSCLALPESVTTIDPSNEALAEFLAGLPQS